GGRSEVNEGGGLVVLSIVAGGGFDDGVGGSVTVHVSGPRHGETEPRGGLVAGGCPPGGRRWPGGGAEIDEGASLRVLTIAVVGSPDDDVGVAIAVDIA